MPPIPWTLRGWPREGAVTGGKVKPLSNQQDKSLSKLANRQDQHNTRKEIAKAAKVGSGTVWKVKQIRESAPTEVAEKARNGQLSVNRAFQVLQAVKDLGKDTRGAKKNLCIELIQSRYEGDGADS